MRHIVAGVFLLLAVGVCRMAWADPTEEVHARFNEWIAAQNAESAEQVSLLYDENARLFSTGGGENPLDGRKAIQAYFAKVFQAGPSSVAVDHDDIVNVYSDIGVETGYYHFNFVDSAGKSQTTRARYTFVFQKKASAWMIVHHHSSRVPIIAAASVK